MTVSKAQMKPRGPFSIHVLPGELIQVWLGQPNDPESDLICTINRNYLPALIAALKASQEAL
mgnify:CR=1 FL=1